MKRKLLPLLLAASMLITSIPAFAGPNVVNSGTFTMTGHEGDSHNISYQIQTIEGNNGTTQKFTYSGNNTTTNSIQQSSFTAEGESYSNGDRTATNLSVSTNTVYKSGLTSSQIAYFTIDNNDSEVAASGTVNGQFSNGISYTGSIAYTIAPSGYNTGTVNYQYSDGSIGDSYGFNGQYGTGQDIAIALDTVSSGPFYPEIKSGGLREETPIITDNIQLGGFPITEGIMPAKTVNKKIGKLKLSRKNGNLTAKWSKLILKGAKNQYYELQISTNKKFAKGKTQTFKLSKNNKTITALNGNGISNKTTYYARVRAVGNKKGMTSISKWSSVTKKDKDKASKKSNKKSNKKTSSKSNSKASNKSNKKTSSKSNNKASKQSNKKTSSKSNSKASNKSGSGKSNKSKKK